MRIWKLDQPGITLSKENVLNKAVILEKKICAVSSNSLVLQKNLLGNLMLKISEQILLRKHHLKISAAVASCDEIRGPPIRTAIDLTT